MKLAFSTLGCPDFGGTELYARAKSLGFDGIEIGGWLAESVERSAPPCNELQPQTLTKLKELRLEIAGLAPAGPLKLATKESLDQREIGDYLTLASQLGAPYLRICIDLEAKSHAVAEEEVLAELQRWIPAAEAQGVTLLLETNGVYSDTARLGKLLDRLASDAVAAAWDVRQTCCLAGERPEKTIQNLGAYIQLVRFQAALAEDSQPQARGLGEGEALVDALSRALDSINYRGFVTLAVDQPEATDLVGRLRDFAALMSRYLKKPVTGRQLFDNEAKTGKYVWEKDTLIDLTFPQVLDRMADEFPDQYAFRFTTLDYTRTYSEFRDDVDTCARALIALGVKAGDHVALWANNLPQWYITFWATTKIGAVLVTVNTAYRLYEIEYLLRHSDTHTLIMNDGYKVGIMQELCPELASAEPGKALRIKRLPFLRNIIILGSKQPGCLTWEEAMERADRVSLGEVYRRARSLNPHDVCNMQYTAGTAGFPKGVMLSHYSMVNNGKNIGDCMDLSTADRMMIQVPMFHCFGLVLAMTASMTHGATMSPLPNFSPRQSLACINQERITCFHGVPTMFIAMLEHEDFAKTDFSAMRTGIMAGSPCPVTVMQDVLEKMHMTQITIVYGLTEAAPGCTQSRVGDSIELRVNTVGRALPHMECKIVDPVTGQDLPDNVDGEFVVRGYNVMKGYYKMPEETKAVIDENGWLHTGDLARRFPNGYYKITGRIKEMLIRGGENIYPKEIENFIATHPKVKEVQVIGVPDKYYGEEAMAFVILKEGETLTEEALKDYARSNIAKHKVPRYIDFITELPRDAAGKVMKEQLRATAIEKLGLQAEDQIVTA